MATDVGGLTDVAGLAVGHLTHPLAATGCTVVLCGAGATAAVDVRGAAPATRETDLLRAENLVQQVHAVLLTGGSAFGLEAAAGVMRFLEERGIGFQTRIARVPIVPAAALFDLGVGDATTRPTAEDGYRACLAADDGPVSEGSVGAGTGATIGKAFGITRATKGGLGTASLRLRGGAVVGALAVVNSYGDVVDPRTGDVLAGARSSEGRLADTVRHLLDVGGTVGGIGESTTLAVVATDALLSRVELQRVAAMAHDGLARAVRPAHSPFDGDAVFALSTGLDKAAVDVLRVGTAAAEVLAEAIVRAALHATSLAGVPSARELQGDEL